MVNNVKKTKHIDKLTFLNFLSKKPKSNKQNKNKKKGILLPVIGIEITNSNVDNKNIDKKIFLFFENNIEEKIKKNENICK